MHTVLLTLLVVCASSGSLAQQARDESGFGNGLVNRAFLTAADEQARTDWPIKSRARPGTAVRLTFDPRNADANLVTDVQYSTARLLATERSLAAEIGLPKTDFIRYPETETAVCVDMEFNRYLARSQDGATVFDFDLSRFAAALLRSDLPRPIVIGVRANHSRLNRVRLVTSAGTRRLDGVMFLRAEEVQPGTLLNWRARIHWSGYAAAALLLVLLPLFMVRTIVASRRRPALTPPLALDPQEVQRRYDRSPLLVVSLLGAPVLVVAGMVSGIVPRALESMMYLVPEPVVAMAVVAAVALALGPVLARFAMQRSRRVGEGAPAPDPDDPPQWTKTGWLVAIMFTMLPFTGLALLLPVWNPLRDLPPAWRHTAPIWLPILMPVIGSLPPIVVWVLAARRTKRALGPGDPWYDRTMEFARHSGVRVKRVVEVWSAAPNAAATIFGEVRLTRGLLSKLAPEEVTAVIAHELGHHIGNHVRRAALVSLSLAVTLVGGWIWLTEYLARNHRLSPDARVAVTSPVVVVLVLSIVRMYLQGRGSRSRELEADRFAVAATGDPELVIRALTRIHDLNAMPHRLKPADEAIHSHPSLDSRIAAIREYAESGDADSGLRR